MSVDPARARKFAGDASRPPATATEVECGGVILDLVSDIEVLRGDLAAARTTIAAKRPNQADALMAREVQRLRATLTKLAHTEYPLGREPDYVRIARDELSGTP